MAYHPCPVDHWPVMHHVAPRCVIFNFLFLCRYWAALANISLTWGGRGQDLVWHWPITRAPCNMITMSLQPPQPRLQLIVAKTNLFDQICHKQLSQCRNELSYMKYSDTLASICDFSCEKIQVSYCNWNAGCLEGHGELMDEMRRGWPMWCCCWCCCYCCCCYCWHSGFFMR